MCLAYLAISTLPEWPLLIAANRDEFHGRPTLVAAPWADHPDVFAGIDLRANGSWLGVTRTGRYALVTNYRDPSHQIENAPSRGDLVREFLTGHEAPSIYAARIHAAQAAYNGFNLIVGNATEAFYVGNRASQAQAVRLGPGRYMLSNHLLDTPWPKAERLRRTLDGLPPKQLDQSLSPLFELLKDTTPADDGDLPQTGLSLDRERLLSSPFIVSPDYGTRCSTIIAIHETGRAIMSEVSYDKSGRPTERHDWPFCIKPGERREYYIPSSAEV